MTLSREPHTTEGSNASARRAESQRVLIVEDERRLREMLLASLQEIGMVATGAPTAEASLKLLDQSTFAILIVDLNLPGMGGMELCEIVHRRWPEIQMIILTGFGDMDAARRAIRLDVVDFLTKPCGMDELEVSLARARQRWIDHWKGESHSHPASASPDPASTQSPSVGDMERQLILDALERHDGNREAAALEVGISVRKLYYRLQQYQQDGSVWPK